MRRAKAPAIPSAALAQAPGRFKLFRGIDQTRHGRGAGENRNSWLCKGGAAACVCPCRSRQGPVVTSGLRSHAGPLYEQVKTPALERLAKGEEALHERVPSDRVELALRKSESEKI